MIFLVPLPLAGLNLALSFCAMMTLVLIADLSPIAGFLVLFAAHGALAIIAQRDPHLATKIRAIGKPRRKTRNILTASHVKYTP